VSSIGDDPAVELGGELEMSCRIGNPGWHRGCDTVWHRAPATERGRQTEMHMKRTLIFTSSVIVAALSLAALPADAQARRNNGHQGSGGRQAAPRQSSRGTSPQARQNAPRGSYSAPQAMTRPSGNRPYSGTQALPRSSGNRSYGNNSYGARAAMPRYNSPSYGAGRGYGYASPGYRGYGGRPGMVRPYFSRSYVRPYGWAPYYPYSFGRPYYAFSPWLSLGFGI
jgi:hypothetical protein